MKLILSLIALLLLTPAYGEELNYNVVSLSAQAEREVPNDLMRVQLQVEHQAPKATVVSQQVNQDMNWALKQLKPNKKLKYETQQYSTHPVYDKRTIKAWRATQQLMVESEDFEALSEVILALQKRLQVKNMSFMPTKRTQKNVEDELVAEALAAFKSRAKLVQNNMQSASYRVVDMNVNTQGHYSPVYRSQPHMKMAMAMAEPAPAPAVEGGTSTMTVSVNGRIQLQ